MSYNIDITILMPCLNEELTLPICIEQAKEALNHLQDEYDLSGEILISDNGSTDNSISLATESGCRVVNCHKKGYGNALIYGGHAARGKYIVMGDSDASYDFRESVSMIEKLLEGYDLCMGNRFNGEIKPGAMPWKNRYIGNPVLSGTLNLFFRSKIGDAHCGLRAFTKNAFDKMHLTSPGMEFASEMVVKATLMKLKVTEVPATLNKDQRDRPPHLKPFRDGWRHLKFLVMFSPLWLFFIPSVIMFGVSLFIFVSLFSTPPGDVFTFGPFWIGNHWMILGGGLFIMAVNMVIFGLVALTYSVKEHCRTLSPGIKKMFQYMKVENAILMGSLFGLFGVGMLLYVYADWSGNEFKGLARIREMVLATVLLVSGIQIILGGFLVEIFQNDNK